MNKLIIVKQYFINILKIDNRSCRLLLLYMLAVCEVQPSAPRTEMVLNEESSSARRLSDNALIRDENFVQWNSVGWWVGSEMVENG